LIPVTLTLTVFLLVRIIFSYTPFDTVQNFIYTIIQEPLTVLGSGLPATIIAVLLIQLFWFFGLHGQIIINYVFDPIWYAINEPIIFGLPIVMNPLILIPWLIAPVVVTIITYFAMSTGLVPPPAGIIVPWTTPPILSGYLATGNAWQGAVLQAFNLLVVIVIWWPFLKLLDKNYYETEQQEEIKE